MMQQTKKKMVLEHLVVHKMNTAADLKQVRLAPQQSAVPKPQRYGGIVGAVNTSKPSEHPNVLA